MADTTQTPRDATEPDGVEPQVTGPEDGEATVPESSEAPDDGPGKDGPEAGPNEDGPDAG